MSKRDEQAAYDILKLVVITLILLTIAAIVLCRWVARAAVQVSLAVARRLHREEGIPERTAAKLAVAWLGLFTLLGLATLDPLLAVVGIIYGAIVARLVFKELTSWTESMERTYKPGALIVGAVKDSWWGGYKPYVIDATLRKQHLLLEGPTGTGKTAAGSHLIAQDLWNGAAVVAIDPKSDYSDAILSMVPEHRIDDVVLLDPSDARPVGINPFHNVPPDLHTLAASELLNSFASYFGGSWSFRQAHIMKMALLLNFAQERSTILNLPRIFTDRAFRQQAAFRCPNEAVRQFWLGGEYDEQWANKDLSPILYKLGSLSTFNEARRIFGQATPRISFDEIVNKKKIFILRAATGVVGSEIADLLASLVVMRVQLETHRRAAHDGPRPFVALWADESSHIESGALGRMIAESRSFGLGAALITQTAKYFSHELQIGLETNIGTRLRTFQEDGKFWLEVKRLNDPEPIVFPHPGPLPEIDRAKIERIRARSRELYGAPPQPDLSVVAPSGATELELRPTASGDTGSRPKPVITMLGGRDLDEEE